MCLLSFVTLALSFRKSHKKIWSSGAWVVSLNLCVLLYDKFVVGCVDRIYLPFTVAYSSIYWHCIDTAFLYPLSILYTHCPQFYVIVSISILRIVYPSSQR